MILSARKHGVEYRPGGRRGQRGSTLFLVLSILGLLILITSTLAYTSRLEVRTSANFRDHTAARIAALSGLQAAPPTIQGFGALTATTQLWAVPMGLSSHNDPNLRVLRDRFREALDHSGGGQIVISEAGANGSTFRAGSARPKEGSPSRLGTPTEWTNLYVSDLSGRLNINLAGSPAAFGRSTSSEDGPAHPADLDLVRFLEAALDDEGLATGQAAKIAEEIYAFRYGPDGKPGLANEDDNANSASSRPDRDGLDNDRDGVVDNLEERMIDLELLDQDLDWLRDSHSKMGRDPLKPTFAERESKVALSAARPGVDDPAEFEPDIRRAPVGDDMPLLTPQMIRSLPSVTDEVWEALAPHVTCFSISPNTVVLQGQERPRLNLNTASLEDIYQRLLELYGGVVPERQIAQYAANLVDWRDPDSVPTRFFYNGNDVVFGLEVVPFITEVYPDAKTLAEDGDDGQFVEIFNPWDRDIEVDGWRLKYGVESVTLKGTIPSEGYLIVTDDYDDEEDEDEDQDTAAAYGSFFGIFQVVDNGRTKQIIESTEMNLPDRRGKVELFNARGHAVDVFEWEGHPGDGTTISFQRAQPSLQVSAMAHATPFDLARGTDREAMREFFTTRSEDSGHERPDRDDIFSRVTTLLHIPAPASPANREEADWSMPVIQLAEDETGIDSQVLDQFYIARPWPDRMDKADLDPEKADRLLELFGDDSVAHGRININTASLPVLMALPGMDRSVAERILDERQELERQTFEQELTLAPPVHFVVPSDLLRAERLWAGFSEQERLERFSRMAELISVGSLSFEVSSFYMKRRPKEGTIGERAGARAVIALDQPGGDILTFEYMR